MKKLKGSVSISRITSNHEPFRYISIRVQDELSGVMILEADISLLEFANAVTGGTAEDVNIKYFDSPHIGKKMEIKHETMPRPHWKATDEECRAIAAPFEVDGWRASIYDMNNHHNWVGQDKVSVSMKRWVEIDPAPDAQ